MKNRIEKVQKRLKGWGVDLLIVDNPIDLYYLTGLDLSAGRLVILETSAELFVDGRYYEACKKSVTISVHLLSKENPMPLFLGKRIGFDASFTTFEAYERLAALKGEQIPLSSPMRTIREIKEEGEIALLRQAADLGSLGFDFAVSLLKEGITEEEVAIELELFWRKKGGERLAFAPHIAFGENGAYPHYHVGKRRLKRGDSVLIDIGVVQAHYHSDMTRVVFFGAPDARLEKIYHVVRKAQAEALALCRPGTPLADLDRAARDFITAEGFGDQFLHSLGHGVGLEIHEAPWVRKGSEGCLEPGMVLTIEPGIYLPGIGGIRLEDTVVITKQGFENLTNLPILASLPLI